MADYNAVMQQLQQQAQQAAQDRMAALMATGQYIQLEDGGLWDVNREQAISKDQVLGDALVPAMQEYVQANPGDPAAQQIQSDLSQMQAAAHKGDFGSLLHGLAVSAAAGGAMSGAFGGGSILGGLPPAGGEMLGEGVFGPPAPGGSFFVGPPTPAAPTPILGEGLMGPPVPGGGFFTGPPTPAAPAVPAMSETIPLSGAATPAPAATGGVSGSLFTPEQIAKAAGEAGAAAGAGVASGVGGTAAIPATAELSGLGGLASALTGGAAAAGSAGTIASAINKMFGTNLTDSDLSILGKLGGAGLGLLGANAQTDALKGILDQQRAERAPALNAFNNMLTNPDSWYSSAPAQGAVDGVLRRLSVNGNPYGNPSDLAKAAAFNLGGYNQALGTLGSLGLSGQATTAQLGTQVAQSGQTPYNIGANLLGQITTPQQNPFDQWMSAAMKYGKQDAGGLV